MDLWPEFDRIDRIRTPVSILVEQASLLGEKTNNVVQGKVVSSTTKSSTFLHRFRIVSPSLEGYSYNLFSVQHEIEIYPAEFRLGTDLADELEQEGFIDPETLGSVEVRRIMGTKYKVFNEDEFINFLRIILSSKRTTVIVTAILSQSEAVDLQSPE